MEKCSRCGLEWTPGYPGFEETHGCGKPYPIPEPKVTTEKLPRVIPQMLWIDPHNFDENGVQYQPSFRVHCIEPKSYAHLYTRYVPASRAEELEKEVGRLREALNNARLNLRAIAEVTECIGLDRRHVDFNCIHCFSLQAGVVAEMVLDHPSAIAAARAALAGES